MPDSDPSALSRRHFLYAVTAATAPVAFLRSAFAEEKGTIELAPTPAVGDHDLQPTPEETAGPFFRPNSPAKSNFREPGVTGVPVNLRVLDRNGKSIAGALLDFWHSDSAGQYDFDGFRCRGHQFADTAGRFALQTIVPGLYPGRTRHYHVRLQSAHGPILSTQLYFPGEAHNSTDSLFRPELLLKIRGNHRGPDCRLQLRAGNRLKLLARIRR
jgi:protocatechuate 3,4-dioxygenase beta subunit